MFRQPLISIIIANYNYGRFLETAIQSVITQSFQDFELMVVDGGSTDNSVEVIRKYADKVTWWCSEKDRGQSHAFNKGFSHARGKFLTWLNADDFLVDGGLTAIAREINKNPSCEWFVGGTCWLDKNLHVVKYFRAHSFSHLRAKYAHLSVGGPSSFFTKRLLEEVGNVDETFHYMMDTELWQRFYACAHQKYIRTTACVWGYRIHEDSKMSGSDVAPNNEKNRNHRERLRIEGEVFVQRFPRPKGYFFKLLVNVFSVSIADQFICWLTNQRLRGKSVYELRNE